MPRLLVKCVIAGALVVRVMPALAQFTPDPELTAAQLNGAFVSLLPLSSRTLTGPLTAPTPSANGVATLPNATISGASINGAPIGNSNPSTGAFTTLSTTGLATLNALSVTNPPTFLFPLGLASGGTNATTATGATSQLQYLQGATGSVARSLTSKLQDTVSAADFSGFDPTGITDSTTAITNAENALGATGGLVRFPCSAKVLISSNLTVNPNVTLEGCYGVTGTPGSNGGASYGNMGGIRLSPSATITLSSDAGVKDLLIYRSGMTFPTADSSLFSGTAVTIGGDDAFVMNSVILGFNKAIYSNGYARGKFEYVLGDNNNGIEVTKSLDVTYISHCHMWPFATIRKGGTYQTNERSGYAYYLHDLVDWGKISDSFSYGYKIGIELSNVNSVTVLNSGSDNVFQGIPLHANSIGTEVLGNSSDIRLIGVQDSAQAAAGIHINTNAGKTTTIIGADIWGGSAHGVLVDGGDVMIDGSVFGGLVGLANGITDNNASSKITVSHSRFGTIASNPINVSVATTTLFLYGNDYGSTANGKPATGSTNSNLSVPRIRSADPLNLPATGSDFAVTGTTSFGSLNGGWAGREVTLYFSGALSVFSGTGSLRSIRLSGGTTFTTTAGSTLKLRHNGVQWYEVGRGN